MPMYCVTPSPPENRNDPIITLDDADALIDANRNILIDLASIEYLGGSSFGAIAYLKKRLEKRGLSLNVCNAMGQPHSILRATGLLPRLQTEKPENLVELGSSKQQRERSAA